MQNIFPILRYNDARAAIKWLSAAFGFRELFSVPQTGEFVRHAQLALGTNIIMLGSCRDDGITSPRSLGAATQALSVYLPNVDEHYERARAAGADIVHAPYDTDFGSHEYIVRDLEGHLWAFGNYRPSVEAE